MIRKNQLARGLEHWSIWAGILGKLREETVGQKVTEILPVFGMRKVTKVRTRKWLKAA